MDYKCLTCGSKHGEPTDNSSENWYWRIVENGRVGPFCSQPCSRDFRLTQDTQFTLMEWERLHFLKWRVLHGQAATSDFAPSDDPIESALGDAG